MVPYEYETVSNLGDHNTPPTIAKVTVSDKGVPIKVVMRPIWTIRKG